MKIVMQAIMVQSKEWQHALNVEVARPHKQQHVALVAILGIIVKLENVLIVYNVLLGSNL